MFLSGLKYLRRLERQVKFAKNRCCKIKPVAVIVGQPDVSLIFCILIFWGWIIYKDKFIKQNYVSLIFFFLTVASACDFPSSVNFFLAHSNQIV